MIKIIFSLVIAFGLIGCQPKEAENTAQGTQEVEAQRKEASRKLTLQAMSALGQQQFQEAVAGLDAAIKFDPTNQDPYLILAQILLKSGEHARAAEFLDSAVKNFPENGTMFYMLSIANRMSNKKLPAVLAARRSYEIFKNANDQENSEKAAVLLQQVINSPDATEGGSNSQAQGRPSNVSNSVAVKK